ncbi:hypothetical protein O6H91_01G122200 [Diphasiastrum complanatum]|uniref:Uncharacterized protein n=1 Tax=Diphasiastrum complanatum TaxID=34168 RepID=A0ACC2EVK0_DIPCM|nr:hypothetical protein O6H91_01G122200 [Diphasiastrum complanatum]
MTSSDPKLALVVKIFYFAHNERALLEINHLCVGEREKPTPAPPSFISPSSSRSLFWLDPCSFVAGSRVSPPTHGPVTVLLAVLALAPPLSVCLLALSGPFHTPPGSLLTSSSFSDRALLAVSQSLFANTLLNRFSCIINWLCG